MKEIEIKIELLKRGVSLTEIALALVEKGHLNVKASHVSGVLKGHRTTLYIREAIAKAISQPLLVVFPGEAYRSPSTGRVLKRSGLKL